jgi:aminoacyl tRNA synthase complex-interacting multifunctional protein 1
MAASFKHERARKFIVSIFKRINSAEDDDAQEAAAASFGGEFGTKGLGFECRSIVEAAGGTAADRLRGTTPEMQAEVSQWLSFASSFDAAKTKLKNLKIDGRLQLLNMHLEDRTVFAGRGVAISLADLSMFAVVHEIVSDEESYPELVQLPHLLRWIDYIQSKDAAAKIFPRIPVEKAKFDPPQQQSTVALACNRISLASLSSSSSTDDKTAAKSVKKTGAEAAAAAATSSSSVRPQAATGSAKILTTNAVAVSQRAAVSETAVREESKAAEATTSTAQQQRDHQQVAQEEESSSKKKINNQKPAAAQKKKESDTNVSVLDIRVGLIKKVWKHPGADALYVEEIDIGEGNVRQVVSGLAKFLTLEQMQNRKVLVLRNVKPGKVRDVLSSGLVLCASNTDHTQCEPVVPPDGARIGERITVAGYEEGSSSPEEILNPKKKQFENLQPDLTTDDAGVANYQGKPFMTTAGACTSSIVNGTIK